MPGQPGAAVCGAGRGVAAALLAALLAGCAASPPRLDRPALDVELTAVPFYPDDSTLCGPTALATVLDWSGLQPDLEALRRGVYLPQRQGSLQPEMAAQARRQGRLAHPLAGGLAALADELAAGHPVLVLQNLGLSWLPRWHYAVVVGLDSEAGQVVLRSGTRRRHVVGLGLFDRTWARGERWGLVVLPPGQLPASARPTAYLAAAADLETTAGARAALPAYAAGARRWPDRPGFPLARANALQALGQTRPAATVLREAAARLGEQPVLLNNLALLEADLGHWDAALAAARRAVALGGPFAEEIRATLEEIERRRPLGSRD